MIDYFDGLVGYDAGALDTGNVVFLKPGGEIQLFFSRWATSRSSWEDDFQFKSASATDEMVEAAKHYNLICNLLCYRIQGNPSKYIQGHNVFGPSVNSLGPVVRQVISQFDGINHPPNFDDTRLPAIKRYRVDITTSIRMDNHTIVHEWIEHARQETRSKHRVPRKSDIKKGLLGNTTVSWGAGSKRWMLTAYCKACELALHQPNRFGLYDELKDYTEGLLRIELRLFTKELRDRGTLDESLIWEFFNRLEIGVMKDDIDVNIPNLKPSTRKIYLLWRDGHDVSPASGLCKRSMFYRYRSEIMKATGQDISLPPIKEKPQTGAREQFNTDYLKAKEETTIPPSLQKHLYVPEDSPVWPSHPPKIGEGDASESV